GVGEKLQALEEFRPEGMAQRIMGQGDIMGLIQKVASVQQQLTQEEIEAQQKKLAKGDFTLDDFSKQFQVMQKMGGMRDIMRQMAQMSIWDRIKMVTGMGKAGAFQPGAMMPKQKIGTGHRKTAKERAEERKKKKKKR